MNSQTLSIARNEHQQGISLIVAYTTLTAIQGVWLSSFLQSVNTFLVLFLTFTVTSLFFTVTFYCRGGRFIELLGRLYWKNILFINLLTLVNWGSFFLALKFIEPAVEAALTSAIPPIITAIICAFNPQSEKIKPYQLFSCLGIFSGGFILTMGSLLGFSAIGEQPISTIALGIVFAIICGISIAIYTVFSKTLNNKSIHPIELMSIRFPLLLVIAFILMPKHDFFLTLNQHWFAFSVIPIIGTIIPLFCLQLAISKLSPIMVSIVITTTPLFFYLVQFFDSRLTQSLYSTVGISVIVLSIIFSLVFPMVSTSCSEERSF